MSPTDFVAAIESDGLVRPLSEGRTEILIRKGTSQLRVPLEVNGLKTPDPISFENQVIPILTGTQKRLTPVTIAQLFSYLHADVFEPLIENRFGNALMTAMARDTDRHVKMLD